MIAFGDRIAEQDVSPCFLFVVGTILALAGLKI
jgi:hypothetical protein